MTDLPEPTIEGLLLRRLPELASPSNPRRWRITHKASGKDIADAMTREDGLRGMTFLATYTDWTQSAERVLDTVDPRHLFAELSHFGCDLPGMDRMPETASCNGSYSDFDIDTAAAQVKAEGMNALQILNVMAQTVPWMGLDTEDFNEAHNRICELSDAA